MALPAAATVASQWNERSEHQTSSWRGWRAMTISSKISGTVATSVTEDRKRRRPNLIHRHTLPIYVWKCSKCPQWSDWSDWSDCDMTGPALANFRLPSVIRFFSLEPPSQSWTLAPPIDSTSSSHHQLDVWLQSSTSYKRYIPVVINNRLSRARGPGPTTNATKRLKKAIGGMRGMRGRICRVRERYEIK